MFTLMLAEYGCRRAGDVTVWAASCSRDRSGDKGYSRCYWRKSAKYYRKQTNSRSHYDTSLNHRVSFTSFRDWHDSFCVFKATMTRSEVLWIENSSQWRNVTLKLPLWLKHRPQLVTRFWDCLIQRTYKETHLHILHSYFFLEYEMMMIVFFFIFFSSFSSSSSSIAGVRCRPCFPIWFSSIPYGLFSLPAFVLLPVYLNSLQSRPSAFYMVFLLSLFLPLWLLKSVWAFILPSFNMTIPS